MAYMIEGLDPQQFRPLFAMDAGQLRDARATRMAAGAEGKYPCRVSLEDAAPGDELALVHFTNHDVETPYRNSFAIYVREAASVPASYIDRVPPILRGRPISLRCYSEAGNLVAAGIALADDVDAQLRTRLTKPEVAYIDSHNAMHGCFAARINRYDGGHDE